MNVLFNIVGNWADARSRLEEGYHRVHRMYHDIRKHLVHILSALDRDEVEHARRYILDREHELRGLMPRRITGPPAVDAMLVKAEGRRAKEGGWRGGNGQPARDVAYR